MPSSCSKFVNLRALDHESPVPLDTRSSLGKDLNLSLYSSPPQTPTILPNANAFDSLRYNFLVNHRLFFTEQWIELGNIASSHLQPLNWYDINEFLALPPSNSMKEPALELPSSPSDSPAQASMNALQYTERLVNALLPADPERPLPHLPRFDCSFDGLEPFTKEVLLEIGLINQESVELDYVRGLQKSLRTTKDDTAALFGRIADGASVELNNQRARRARKTANDKLELRYLHSQLNKHQTNKKKHTKTKQAIYRNFRHYPHVREEYAKSIKIEKERRACKDKRVSMATHTRSATRKMSALKRTLKVDSPKCENIGITPNCSATPNDQELECGKDKVAERKPPIILRLPLRKAGVVRKKKSEAFNKNVDQLASLWVNGTLVSSAPTANVGVSETNNMRKPAPESDIGWWATWCGANVGDISMC